MNRTLWSKVCSGSTLSFKIRHCLQKEKTSNSIEFPSFFDNDLEWRTLKSRAIERDWRLHLIRSLFRFGARPHPTQSRQQTKTTMHDRQANIDTYVSRKLTQKSHNYSNSWTIIINCKSITYRNAYVYTFFSLKTIRLSDSFLPSVGPAVDPISLNYRTKSDRIVHLFILIAERTRFPREAERYLKLRTRAPKIAPYIAEVNRNPILCVWIPYRETNSLPTLTHTYYITDVYLILMLHWSIPYFSILLRYPMILQW